MTDLALFRLYFDRLATLTYYILTISKKKKFCKFPINTNKTSRTTYSILDFLKWYGIENPSF